MAKKPLKPCNVASCRNLTAERYCKEHEQVAEQERKERHKQYDRYKRDKDVTAFYKSKAWVLVRQQALTRDKGLCQHCIRDKRATLADMVDHIVPVKVDWSLRLVLINLQSLCNQCHSIKTAEDKRKYGDKA